MVLPREVSVNESRRGSWLVAGAILLGALVIAGAIWFSGSNDRACKRFQAAVTESIEPLVSVTLKTGGDASGLREDLTALAYSEGEVNLDSETVNKPEGCSPP